MNSSNYDWSHVLRIKLTGGEGGPFGMAFMASQDILGLPIISDSTERRLMYESGLTNQPLLYVTPKIINR
jgi:hypothetical protein